MKSKSQVIKETLQFKDLTPEEKEKRGILGRLYGPCASITIPTRNGRKYDEKLWDYQFANNAILREMIENGGVPMELDHPTDREETQSDKIAAMMPELPKKDKDGHLITYVDIIDTPMGRIAYQLAKYGFKLGISSRGSGDIVTDDYGNESVNPETYDLTTFDLVLVPAVKDARLNMCESLNKNNKGIFKSALNECLNKANEEDKKFMVEAINNAGIKLQEDDNEEVEIEVETPEVEEDECENIQKYIDTASEKLETAQEEEEQDCVEFYTFVLKLLNDYNAEKCDSIDDESQPDEGEAEEEVEVESEVQEVNDVESEKKDEIDIASLVDNLQKAVTERASLEESIKHLQEKLAVSDSKVSELKGEVSQYKDATIRLSSKLNESKKSNDKVIEELNSTITKLNENLNSSNETIKSLTDEKEILTESLAEEKKKSLAKKPLNEDLANKTQALNEEFEKLKEDSTKQINVLKKQLKESKSESNALSNLVDKLANKYISTKASSLGLEEDEIKNKLSESYTIEDVDRVCEELVELNSGFDSLPFNISKKARVEITRPKTIVEQYQYSKDDVVDENLIDLVKNI